MLTLTIKGKWFGMILTGKKKEEYREVKPYYTMRFRQFMTVNPNVPDGIVEGSFRAAAADGGVSFHGVRLRNGYRKDAPELAIKGRIMIRTGNPEWGAEEGREYYVLTIEDVEVIRAPLPEGVRKRKMLPGVGSNGQGGRYADKISEGHQQA